MPHALPEALFGHPAECAGKIDVMFDDPLVIAGRSFRSRLIVGTGKYPSHAIMADAHGASGRRHGHGRRPARQRDRPQQGVAARLHRHRAGLHPAQHRRLLHRRGRDPHRAPRPRSRAVELGQARGDRRRAHPLPRQRRAARGDAGAGERRLRRPALHERRPDHLPQARGGGRRRGDAARRADRLGPRHPEPQQHPHHPRAIERAGHRRRRRRRRRPMRRSRWSSARTAC